jgi:hypothetical protein
VVDMRYDAEISYVFHFNLQLRSFANFLCPIINIITE